MTFSKEQIEALKAPLNKSHVKQRSQAGRSLSYIEGWHAIDEANRIFGFDTWDRETVELKQITDPYQDQKGNWRVAYMAKVKIRVWSAGATFDESHYINRDGCGYGSGIDRDLGSAHESALKEAETDAMKRALMTFGNPFGLALYDKEQKNVVNEPAKSSPVEVQQDTDRTIVNILISSLRRAQTVKDLAEWFASNKQTVEDLPEAQTDEVRGAYADRLHELRQQTRAA